MTVRSRGCVAWVAGILVALGIAGAALAAGYGTMYSLPASGTLAVTNLQANAVWRPVVVAIKFAESASRTVTVARVVGGITFPISTSADVAQSFIYEFDAPYWFSMSNVLQVSVSPASTGDVEVIYE